MAEDIRRQATLVVWNVIDEETVREFHRTMLVPNFVPDELVSVESLVEGVRSGSTNVLAGSLEDGPIVAGAVGEWYSVSRVQLLAYLVVSEAMRGRRAGSRVLNAAITQWRAELEPLLIVGEVEDPRHFEDVGLGDPVARVRFYERLGVRSLPIPYAQPALTPESSRVPHLILMVFAMSDQARLPSGNVDGGIAERFLVEYFESAEGPLDPADAELEAMFAACRLPAGLPLMHAHELPEY